MELVQEEPIGATRPERPKEPELYDAEDTIIVDIGAIDSEGEPEPEPEARSRVTSNITTRARGRLQAQSAIEVPRILKSYTKAINDPIYGENWRQVISEELTKLQALDTWEYTDLLVERSL